MMTKSQAIARELHIINAMSQDELAHIFRFSDLNHAYFDQHRPFYKVFISRLKWFGGLPQAGN